MKVLLYNHSGCENRGCEAIVRSTSALLAQRGARTILTSGQAESDGGLRLPDVERVVAEQISPYSVSRLINSIGFRGHAARARGGAPVSAGDSRGAEGGRLPCRRQRHLYYGPQGAYRVINGRLHRAGKPLVLWGCSVNPELIGANIWRI